MVSPMKDPDEYEIRFQNYHRECDRVNSEFDMIKKNKPFYISAFSIEEERKEALAQVHITFYGHRGGFFCE